jgi:signal transduction histidine kinase
MAERARRVGGELVVQPSDRGTTLSLTLPLPAPA